MRDYYANTTGAVVDEGSDFRAIPRAFLQRLLSWVWVSFLCAAVLFSSCAITPARPTLLLNAAAPRQPIVVDVDEASMQQRYRFVSWLSFPAIGPYTYQVGNQFTQYVSAFERYGLASQPTGTPLRLRLVLVEYQLSTFYRAACSVRATLVDPSTNAVLLDRNYAAAGGTAFQRVMWGGWFFGAGTRSAVRVSTQEALNRAFSALAADLAAVRSVPSEAGEPE